MLGGVCRRRRAGRVRARRGAGTVRGMLGEQVRSKTDAGRCTYERVAIAIIHAKYPTWMSRAILGTWPSHLGASDVSAGRPGGICVVPRWSVRDHSAFPSISA